MKSRFAVCFCLVLPFAMAQAQSTNSPDDQVHVQPRKMPKLPEKVQPPNAFPTMPFRFLRNGRS